MSQRILTYISTEEYLRRERQAEYKSEYLNGEIFAMGGASEVHNLIAGNIFGELRQQLKERSCRVYISDMRVKVHSVGLYTYPDVVIVCGEPEFEDNEFDTLLNPTVLIEVLSKSTERSNDRFSCCASPRGPGRDSLRATQQTTRRTMAVFGVLDARRRRRHCLDRMRAQTPRCLRQNHLRAETSCHEMTTKKRPIARPV